MGLELEEEQLDSVLLDVRGLNISFSGTGRDVRVVRDLSLQLKKGECLGLVGESGCGKTVTGLAVAGALKYPGCKVEGSIRFLSDRYNKAPHNIKRKRIAMVYQEGMAALNPVLTVKKQMTELIRFHCRLSSGDALVRAWQLLQRVGFNDVDDILRRFPGELSGGMAQRVCLAMALCCEPEILIADEPTTALDTINSAIVMKALAVLKKEMDLAVILISHDLAAVAQNCDRLLVMYMGKVVEEGSTWELLSTPLHPYSRRLIETFFALEEGRHDIEPIRGQVPGYHELPMGCAFYPRCEEASENCSIYEPELLKISENRKVACHLYSGRNKGAL